jgi:phosphoribosylamine--glycine ligase
MNILLLGSGGREHTLAWKMAQSKLCRKLFIAPGNGGTLLCGTNVDISDNNIEGIKAFIKKEAIDMLVVGPEQALVNGIYDAITSDASLKNVIVIGPSQKGSQLEGSKDYAKKFMQKHKIPTAAYQTFTKNNLSNAYDFIDSLKPPYVLKADGLAAGKGVVICDHPSEAKTEIDAMLVSAKFGKASEKIVIEEFLKGIELSVFVLSDGHSYLLLPSAKDYKRIGEHDTGLNTGGMGSISPVPFADEAFMQKVEQQIIIPTIEGLKKDGIVYKGFIFFGLMNVKGNPYVIEYNVRMGDPETESVIPRIENDLVDLFVHVGNQTLNQTDIHISSKAIATIMLVSKGYPETYEKGKLIRHLDQVCDSLIFHAGTKKEGDNKILSNGGRVLAVTSFGDSLEEALALSYRNAERIDFENKYYRSDIGKDVL